MKRSQVPNYLHFTAILLALALAACGSDDDTSTTTDAGVSQDAGATDSGATDAGATDAGAADTGATDSGAADSGPADSGTADASGASDASTGASKYNDFKSALELTAGADATKESLIPTGESDFFKFEGKKGDATLITLMAQETPFDSEAIDTVITVYDADEKQVAANDDPEPRNTNDSSLYMILPKDGTYYVKVQECWTWLAETKINGSCAEPKAKTKPDYSIFVGVLNDKLSWVVKDEEKGDTAADSSTVGYEKNQAGTAYNLVRIFGFFTGINDTDWYTFVMPKDISTTGSRLQGSFTPMAHGVDGNGSTTSLGLAAISLASAPTEVVASVDLTNKGSSLGVPLKAGETYLLSVKHPGTTAGSNDFYFLNHRASSDNPLETADTTNNELKTPETMQSGQGSIDGGTYFFVTGDIAPITDVDHYSVTIPTGMENGKITVACSAQRAGSGLRGFELTLMKEDGSKLAGGATIESEGIDAVLSNVAIGGVSKLIIQFKADKQAADVSSTFYRCGVQVSK